MKTSNKLNAVFKLISLLFSICCFISFIIQPLRINSFGVNNFSGEQYFTSAIIVYSFGIILGVTFLIMYLFLFRKYKIQFGILYLIIVITLFPFLACGSLNYYKDLYNGKIEFETEIYKIPVESYYEDHPDKPKEIELSDYPILSLTISDEMYIDLIKNNPYDQTRLVYNPKFNEKTYPHMYHIIIKFYENTGIVDSVQIVYDEK